MRSRDYPYTISVGLEAVSLRARGESAIRVGNILGRVAHEDGSVSVYVDRLLHGGGEVSLADGVSLSGAVSTIAYLPAETAARASGT